MTQDTLFNEDLELDELRQAEENLRLRQKEFADLPKKLEREQKERACTMPPLADISERERRKRYEDSVTRGQVANLQRAQRRSIALLLLLIVATTSLVMWGLKLMEG